MESKEKGYTIGNRGKPALQVQHFSRTAPEIEISQPASAAYKANPSERFQRAILA